MGNCSNVDGGGGGVGWGAGCVGAGCTFFAGRLDDTGFCAAYDELAIRAKATTIRNPNLRRTTDIKDPNPRCNCVFIRERRALLICNIVALDVSKMSQNGFPSAPRTPTTLDDALDLAETVKRTGLVFGLTHNYTDHPMVRQAREMVMSGELGPIRLVQVEYAQDWLATPVEKTG